MTVSGVVYFVRVTPDRVDIVDYRTDRGRHGEPEYRRRSSVHDHVVREAYPEREIGARILSVRPRSTVFAGR